ncbi:MAG TPA: asparaginase [Pirellulaceae bacterium]|mgnify:CR=1 FL=1|nr:asparaginase [Pirellulaceae bacterium]
MRIERQRSCYCWLVFTVLSWLAAPILYGQPIPASELSGVLVEVTRGPIVEGRHYGRLVVVTPDGKIVRSVGDPQQLILPRSALKPFQAMATIRLAMDRGFQLSTEEIAIMCASHEGHDEHLAVVGRLLKRIGCDESALFCGAVGGTRLRHNCSGKHSGMLVLTQLLGADPNGYWEIDHPVQQRMREAIVEFTSYDQPLEWGIDGCGVPNYALPLYNLALGYARLANPDAAPEPYRAAAVAIGKAMQAHPELISSRGSFDAQLMESSAGKLIGKTGAEACYGLGLTDPDVGVAVKIEDGGSRGMPQVLLAVLDRLGAMNRGIEAAVGDQRTRPITNSRGDKVGEIRPAKW